MTLKGNATRFTRRSLAALLTAAPALRAQQQQDVNAEARERIASQSREIRAVALGPGVEPAFRFEP